MRKILSLSIILFGVINAYSKPNPPNPGQKIPIAPPGAPIDENIFIMLLIAILFAGYVVYTNNKTKASILN